MFCGTLNSVTCKIESFDETCSKAPSRACVRLDVFAGVHVDKRTHTYKTATRTCKACCMSLLACFKASAAAPLL